jgi:two-component system, OmpR family, sensor histidine kinase KdpD
MNEKRPSPELLLARIKEEEKGQVRGKLKIFFGAAPGVGKTHAMLESALEKLAEGVDVIAGIVETHDRKDIANMLLKLEQLPQREIDYHGKVLGEFDLDKALLRKPAIILVDELAHTNLPGSRHAKRWQDINELLSRGIDVYSTLNVQHLESINDVVAQITGIEVREIVPDAVLEEANAVELIDLPLDDLLKRLQEGKVYAPDQAELAKNNFFNKGNLIALRELALRITAERVNDQVLSYRENQSIQKTWPTTERLLVWINHDAASAKLVRVARRMAARLRAKWMAVYIEPPRAKKLSSVEEHYLARNFSLAERLGGETFTLIGRDPIGELVNFARDCNVTKLVVGKDIGSRLKILFFGSAVETLIRRSGDMDVYIVKGGYDKNPRLLPIITFKPTSRWSSYLYSIAAVILCTLFGVVLHQSFELSNLNMIYLLGIVVVAMRGERGPAIFTSFLSVIAFAFFFVPPVYAFEIPHLKYLINFAGMFIVAIIVSYLALITKQQTGLARLRERRTAALYALNRKLASCRGMDKILHTAAQHIAEVFDSQVAILLPDDQDKLAVKINQGEKFVLDEKEESVAHWVYDLGQIAGLGTQTLPFIKALYLPLLGAKAVVGALRVLPIDPNRLFIPEQIHLLETFAHQVALVIEVEQLAHPS